MDRIKLDGTWTLQFGPQSNPARGMEIPKIPADWASVEAQVPGNVELDLIEAGLLPENLEKGDAIYRLRELEAYQWWYSRDFEADNVDRRTRYELVAEGVDTLASVWLNGERVGRLDNMLIPHRLDVTRQLRGGTNRVVIGIDSTVLAAHEEVVEAGSWAMENNWESLTIRKAAHSFGWDIMPRAVSAGLWRSVYIERVETTRFRSVYLATAAVDVDEKCADLQVRWDIAAGEWPIDDWSVKLSVTSLHGELVHRSLTPVLSTHGLIVAHVSDVDLWWPRGFGDPSLYDVRLHLLDGAGSVRADWRSRFGFRTVRLESTSVTDTDGSGAFCFLVNGEKVFVKGTNWVPLDAFHSRDAAHLDEALDLAVDLNCNMIRCWGGNVYESSAFFGRCDEEGLMVWQDFSFACALYPQTPDFHRKVRAEAETIIPLLRNHPSLVLWAGNNEIDAFYSFAKPTCDPNLDDAISREVLPSCCRRLDPWRHYLPSSPFYSPELWSIGAPHDARPEDHLWGPRDDFKGPFYLSSNAHFVSEVGYHGCPARSSLEKMMTPERIWPWQENDEWLTHAVRPQRRGTAYNYRIALMAQQIGVLFGTVPDDLDDFIFASQVSQAEALKFFIERFRIAKGRRSGILWWNLRDGWPQISDAVVDYYGERKLAYHVIKRVQRDVCVMIDEPIKDLHDVVAVNDTRAAVDLVATIRSHDVLLEKAVRIPPNGKVGLGKVPAAAAPRLYEIEWRVADLLCHNHYVAGPRPFSLAECRDWYENSVLH